MLVIYTHIKNTFFKFEYRMRISKIYNIKNAKIRIFPFQTMDYEFILFADLPSSYLLTLLIEKLWFNIDQFVIDYVFPFEKYVNKTLNNIESCKEDYFIFYLENFYHSSEYALWFLELVLDRLSKSKNKPKIFIHTLKTPDNKQKSLIEKFDFIFLIINWDIELFFLELFHKKTDILEIPNIIFRSDDWNIHFNNEKALNNNLWEYLLWAYYSWHYTKFFKNKDSIISLIDEDNEFTDDNIYYRWSKEKYIKKFRYYSQTDAMLSTWRWCKYNCSYCFRWTKYNDVRQIPLSVLKKDLDYLQDLHYEYIYFYDDCFITTNLNRIDEIIELLSRYNFSYWIATRYEVCTPTILNLLSKLNIKRIQIWLQSISLKVNRETKRWFNLKEFSKTFYELNNLGISVSLDLILWLPWEWLKGFLKTFNYAMSLNPISIYINTLFLNPGTELFINKEKYWIKALKRTWHKPLFSVPSIFSSNDFTYTEIQIAKKYIKYYINKMKSTNIVLR